MNGRKFLLVLTSTEMPMQILFLFLSSVSFLLLSKVWMINQAARVMYKFIKERNQNIGVPFLSLFSYRKNKQMENTIW